MKLSRKTRLRIQIVRFILACRRNKIGDEAIKKMVEEKFKSNEKKVSETENNKDNS